MPKNDLSNLLSQLAEAQQTANPAQQVANKANAQKSTGPRTPEGKARAKMNALRHGLTGQFYVLSEADRLAYNDFETNLLEALAPVGHYERDLAVSITQNRWRLHRARAMESNIQGLGQHDLADNYDTGSPETEVAITQAQTWLISHQALTNLTLYENRIRRDVARDKNELDELQATRKAAEAQAREEAELLVAQSLMNKEPLASDATVQVNVAQPSGLIPTNVLLQDKIEVNGFEFSTTNLIAGLNRKFALESARFYKSNNWDRTKPFPKPFPKAA